MLALPVVLVQFVGLVLLVGHVPFVLLVGLVILFLTLAFLRSLQPLVTLSQELVFPALQIPMIAEQAFQATYISTVPAKTSTLAAAAAARVP